MHPNGIVTGYPAIGVEQWVVRRWISTVSGSVEILGTIAKGGGSGGDGITGRIIVDGTQIWSQYIAPADRVGVNYTVITSVNVGSKVDFVVSPHTSDWYDTTRFTAKISATSPDFTVTAIEVTQGIQCLNNPNCFGASHRDWCPTEDCNNAVPLLLNKPTWVRVYVKSNMETDVGVTGLLKGFYTDGTDLPQLASLLFFIPEGIMARTNGGDRGNSDDTLNFQLPIEWTRQDRITLEARIYPTGFDHSTGSDTKRIDVTFRERNPLRVYSWRFRFPGGQVASEADARAATDFMARVYPLNTDAVTITDQSELPTKATTWGGLIHDLQDACYKVKRKCRDPQNPSTCFEDPSVKCYGWVPSGVSITPGFYGYTISPVSVGYVYRDPLNGQINLAPQYIMAHEIGHTFSFNNVWVDHVATTRCHADAGGTFESQFPNNTGSIGEYGFWGDESAQQVYAPAPTTPHTGFTNYYDFMSYCGVDNNLQWVSPYTYKYLYEAIGAPSLARTASAITTSTQRYLIASGVISPDDSAILYPFYHEVYPVGTDDLPGGGPYSIELQDTQGIVLFTRFFDQRAAELPSQGAPVQFFEVLPFPSGTSRILIKRSTTVLREMSPSPNVPQVTVLAPSSGQTVDGMMDIRWTGSDADGELLHYMVEYSADGGNTWRTIGVDLTDTTLVVKADDLPGTTQGKIRVLATDGINTGIGDSGLFAVARKPPKVYILSPQDRAVIYPGQWLHLSGLAEDREDGLLRDAALVWMLDDVTEMGAGRQLTLFNPSPGMHTITLTATDSDGNEGTATVSIFVGHRIYLPFAAKGHQGE
jgi:hypothetical protein